METEETPYIETPDELDDDPEKNGLMCFIDGNRQCGADCMAYNTFPAEGKQMNDEQKHCMLLVAADRLGRHSGIVAKFVQDMARTSGPNPRSPFGGA